MAADEALAYATFVAHRRIMRAVIDAHDGWAVGGAGDSLLAEFGSVERAMRAAVAMQEQLSCANWELSPERRLEFRVGVNLGDVLDDGGDLHGHSINVAARLQMLAAPGGIAVSGAIRDQIESRLDIALRDGGWRRVKNIAEPLRVFHVEHRRDARCGPGRSLVRRALDGAMAALGAAMTLAV